jgi:hypothetical protein
MNSGASGFGEDQSSQLLPAKLAHLKANFSRRYQSLIDKTIPHTAARWGGVVALLILFLVRVWFLQGWYIVTYALGIYMLNLLIGFLSPLDDLDSGNEGEVGDDGEALPLSSTRGFGGGGGDGEFKPFVRKLPEFKFWYMLTRAVVMAMVATFFSLFNIPVFWPILVVYFIALVFVQLKARLQHMRKHGYVPFSFGKPQFNKSSGAGGGFGDVSALPSSLGSAASSLSSTFASATAKSK